MSVAVEQAYAEVERLTRARARNFSYGIRLLPKSKRRAIAAIYAFAREVDDAADDPALSIVEKRARLAELGAALDVEPSSPMLVALADARSRFPIRGEALHALVAGGLQDTEQARYSDFDELLGYCRKVAGAVGVACIAVYGADQPQRAEAMGVALQLINIMRDVDEDWSLGRVYIPQDELASYGVSEGDIAAGRCTPGWQALMAYQAARARSYLQEGRTLLPYLDRRSAACVAAFANLYEATLERIERSGFDVFGGPPTLSPLTKLRIVGSGLVLR
ncbi:MAG TPA: phytoene/squalene synthase family protein [Gaiellaceae bacterium]|nr:phytoene/squalene synthase family protein [Gaiellaceae bacterium]